MTITYKSGWDGKEKEWDGKSGYYFPIVDAYPTNPNVAGQHLQFEYGAIGKNQQTVEAVEEWFRALLVKYPNYDWSKSNARIVKAPCAFDARIIGIVIKSLI
jgi:hypothetical protein